MTKERLKEYRFLKLEAAQLEAELLELLNASDIGGGALDGLPKGGELADLTAKRAIASVELYALLNKKSFELLKRRAEVESFIEELEGVERVLMRERYVYGKRWEDVMMTIGYGWSRMHDVHSRILRRVSGTCDDGR